MVKRKNYSVFWLTNSSCSARSERMIESIECQDPWADSSLGNRSRVAFGEVECHQRNSREVNGRTDRSEYLWGYSHP